MSNKRQPPPDSSVLGVVHRAGGSWRVLIASTRNRKPEILEASEIAPERAHAVDAALAKHNAGRVIFVLPASSVICRTSTLPDVDPEQLEQALRLQAEAHLLGNAPEHRLAMAVLQHAPGETSRTGVILAWPDAARVEMPSLHRPVRFAPDVAALAALLDGLRPADPLLWVDRDDGSIALAVTHASGAVFRATREQAADTDGWQKSVSRVLAETALTGGHTGPFVDALVAARASTFRSIPDHEAALILPGEILDHAAGRVGGAQHDPAWWNRFGIATGVLLAACGELAGLTALEDEPKIKKPSHLSTIAASLSRPNIALVTVLICLIIIGFAPVAAARLRLALLQLRHPDIEQEMRYVDRAKGQIAMYRALEKQSWSMVKLLSDIVSAAPQGIELDSIRLSHTDQSFHLSGQAISHGDLSATEVIKQMQENLNASRLFADVDVNWDVKRTSYGFYEFDLSAKVQRPHRRQRIAFGSDVDWANWTLAARKAGKDRPADVGETPDAPRPASSSPPPGEADDVATALADAGSASGDGGPEETPPPTHRPSRDFAGPWSNGSSAEAGERGRVEDRGGGIDPDSVPESLTQEQVDRMTRKEALKHLIEIDKARERARKAGEEELKARLQNDHDLLLAHLRKLRESQ